MTIGDWEPADSVDTAPADPEQVARKLIRLRGLYWDDLTDYGRHDETRIAGELLAWLRRQGAT